MKKIFFIKISILVLLVAFAGCTKDLNLIPKDTISDASFWQTVSDFQKAANTLYTAMPGHDKRDLDSDLGFVDPNSVSNSTYTLPDTDGNWTNPYKQIRNCNKLLEMAEKSSIAGDIKQYVAEAKFFRALNYWFLYRHYGGVPIVTKVLDVNSPELYGERATAKETVDLILKDLSDAVADLPEQSALANADKGRITKGAANALKARIALFEGTWRKFRNDGEANSYLDVAISASNAVMSSGQYEIFTAYGDTSYWCLFVDQGDDAPECILDRRYETLVSQHGFSYNVVYGWGMTKKLADMYLCSNGYPIENSQGLFQGYQTMTSEYQNRDPRMTQTFGVPGHFYYEALYPDPIAHYPFYPIRNTLIGYFPFKYANQNPNLLMPPNQEHQGFDYHFIRYAEVLLIYAEATFERSGSISNADLDKSINLLRDRVNMPHLTNEFVTANGLSMRDEIRRERTVELALEGFRWDDLRRWKTAEIEMPKAIRGIKIKGTEWATAAVFVNGTDQNIYKDPAMQAKVDADGFYIGETAEARSGFDPEKHYLMPIPAKQIQLNPQLKQNPKW